jgi:Domain of unknown function (DUF5658)
MKSKHAPVIFSILFFLNALDLITTLFAPQSWESNRLIRWIAQSMPFEAAVAAAKLPLTALLVYLYWKNKKLPQEDKFLDTPIFLLVFAILSVVLLFVNASNIIYLLG